MRRRVISRGLAEVQGGGPASAGAGAGVAHDGGPASGRAENGGAVDGAAQACDWVRR